MRKNGYSIKIFSVIIVLVMLISLLTACGNSSNVTKESNSGSTTAQGTEAKIPAITITQVNMGWAVPDPKMDVITPAFEKKLGIDITLNNVACTNVEDLTQKVQMWVAGNEYPDILICEGHNIIKEMANSLGEQGKLYAMNDVVKKYSNARKFFEPCMDLYKNQKDGNAYVLPAFRLYPNPNKPAGGIVMRQDILDSLGLSYAKTPDEFYNILKTVKDKVKDPNGNAIIPFTCSVTDMPGDFYNAFLVPFTGNKRAVTVKDGVISVDEDKYQIKPLTDCVVFVNKLYRDGLLDKECFTQKKEQFTEKMSAGMAFGGAEWQDYNMNTYNDALVKTQKDAMLVKVPNIAGPGISKIMFGIDLGGYWYMTFSKKMDESQLDAIMRLFDFTMTTEGAVLSDSGIEGTHWQYNSNHKIEQTQQIKDINTKNADDLARMGFGFYSWVEDYKAIDDSGIKEPSAYDLRKDNITSWKNNYGNVEYFEAYENLPQGPVSIKKSPEIDKSKLELITQACMASSEEKCREIISKWPERAKQLGEDEVTNEYIETIKAFGLGK